MNRKTILATLLTATLGYTTSVSAQDVTIDQPGDDNIALVNQLGENHTYIMQSGSLNNAWINQDNLNNHVNVNQDVNSFQSHAEAHQTGESNVNTFTGYRNSINVMQVGTGNSATVNMN